MNIASVTSWPVSELDSMEMYEFKEYHDTVLDQQEKMVKAYGFKGL